MKSLILGLGILSLSVLVAKCSAKPDCPEIECSHPCPHGYEVEHKTGCHTCECLQPHKSRRQVETLPQNSCTCTCGSPGNEQVIKLPWPLPSRYPDGGIILPDIIKPFPIPDVRPLPFPEPDGLKPFPLPEPIPDGLRPVPIPFPIPDGLKPFPLPEPIPDGLRPVPIPFPIPDGLKPIPDRDEPDIPRPDGDRDEPDIPRPDGDRDEPDIPRPDSLIPLPVPFPDDGSNQPLLIPIPRPGGSSLIPIPGGIKVIGIPGVVVNGQIPSLDAIYRLIPALRPENLPKGVKVEVVPGGFQIFGIPGLPGDGGSRDISTILRLFPSLAPTLGIQITVVPNQGGIPTIPIKIAFGPGGGIQISGFPGIGDGGKIPQLSDILKVLPGLRPESLPPGVKINFIPGGFTLSGIPGLPTDGSQPNIQNILKLIPGLQPVFTPSLPSFPDNLKPIDFNNLPNLPIKIAFGPGGIQISGFPGIGDGGKIPQLSDILKVLPGLRPESLPPGVKINFIPGGFTLSGIPGLPTDGSQPNIQNILKLIPGLQPVFTPSLPSFPDQPFDISKLLPHLPNFILPGVKIEGRPGGIKIIGFPGIGDGGKVPQLPDVLSRLPGLRPENLPKGVSIQLIPGGFQISGVTGFPTDGSLPDLGRLLQLIPGLLSIFKFPILPTDPTNPFPGFPVRIPGSVKIEGKPGGFQIVGIPGIGDNGQVPLLSDLLTKFPGLRPDALPNGSKLDVVPGGFKITGIPGLSVTGGAPNIQQLVQLIPGLLQIFGIPTPSPLPNHGKLDPFNLPPGMKLRLPAGVKIEGKPGALYITGVEGLGVGGKIPELDDILDRLPELESLPSGLRIEGIAGGFRIVGVTGFPTDGSTPDFLQIVQRIPGLLPIFGFSWSQQPVPVPIGPGVPIALPPGVNIVGTPGGFQITGIPGLGVGGSVPQVSQIIQRIPGLNALPPGAEIEGIAGGFRISGIAGFPADGRVDILTILKLFPGLASALGIQIFNVPDPRPNPNTSSQSPFNLNLPASAKINTGPGGLEITGVPGLGDGGTIPQLAEIVQRFPTLKAENLPTGSKVTGIPGGFRVSGFVGFTSETIPGSVQVVDLPAGSK